MTWQLPHADYVQFRRNPIEAVIAQVRFLPILRVERDVAAFQERVRGGFPRFATGRVRDVQVDFGSATISERPQHTFTSLDGHTTIALSAHDMSIVSRKHERRAEFLKAATLGTEALVAEYGQVVGTRVGLRYVNRIDRARVARDLGDAIAWSDLVHEEFLRMPRGLADLQSTLSLAEVRSTMPSGELTLRYGLVQDRPAAEPHFRLDADRYLGAEFDAANTASLLAGFAVDIYAVFRAVAAPALVRWMQPIEEGA